MVATKATIAPTRIGYLLPKKNCPSNIRVTHHITIIAGLGTITFLPIVGGNAVIAVLIGTICGLLSGLLGEVCARVFHNSGNTHFDPPAAAIWPMTLVVKGLAALIGVGAGVG